MPTTHLDDEAVQRLLHDELTPPAATAARQHLADCAACRSRVGSAQHEEVEIHRLLGELDQPAPRVEAEALRRRAGTRERAGMRWAAGILFAIGAGGVAYAVPGSPLPGWLRDAVRWVVATPEPVASRLEPGVSGVAVTPGERLAIVFTAPQTDGAVSVLLTDGAEVLISAPPGAATFTAGISRLVIENTGSTSSYTIHIPRSAPRIEIQVGEDLVFLKEGSQVTGPYAFRLAPPRP